MDAKNNLLDYIVVSQGSKISCVVEPGEVLRPAILSKAVGVIFIHNHTDGDSEPSIDDLKLTDTLRQAFNVCGINVYDHIIIGKDDYFSFKQKNLL